MKRMLILMLMIPLATLAVEERTVLTVPAGTTGNTLLIKAGGLTNGYLGDVSGNSIGWDRTQGASNSDGCASAKKMMYLPAGCKVAWNVEPVAEEDFTWNHGTFRVERK